MFRLLAVVAAAAVLVLTGCASQPGYHKAQGAGGFGYSDASITSDHVRVSYKGDHSLSRGEVEKFALFRAAEVTIARSHDRFRIVSRDTSPVTTTERTAGANVGFGWGSPYVASGFGVPLGVESRTRYESVLDIQLGREIPQKGPAVYDAHEVKKNLAYVVADGD